MLSGRDFSSGVVRVRFGKQCCNGQRDVGRGLRADNLVHVPAASSTRTQPLVTSNSAFPLSTIAQHHNTARTCTL